MASVTRWIAVLVATLVLAEAGSRAVTASPAFTSRLAGRGGSASHTLRWLAEADRTRGKPWGRHHPELGWALAPGVHEDDEIAMD